MSATIPGWIFVLALAAIYATGFALGRFHAVVERSSLRRQLDEQHANNRTRDTTGANLVRTVARQARELSDASMEREHLARALTHAFNGQAERALAVLAEVYTIERHGDAA